MEPGNSRGAIAEALAGTATQRGVKLGIIAGCLTIFLLFGASALQHGSSGTINLAQGQIGSLILAEIPGFLTLVIAMVLAYYAGLSVPDPKSGETTRDGLIAGCITMLLFWAGQTLYLVVVSLGTSQGLELGSFLGSRLEAALLFFVVGGVLGWGGSRAAERRAHSILMPPTSGLLDLAGSSADKPTPIHQTAPPAQDTTASSSAEGSEQGEEDEAAAWASQEAPADAAEQEREP